MSIQMFTRGSFSSFVVRSWFVIERFFPSVVARFSLSAFRGRVGYCLPSVSSVGFIGNVGINELYRTACLLRLYSAIACRVCLAFGITSLHQHIYVVLYYHIFVVLSTHLCGNMIYFF